MNQFKYENPDQLSQKQLWLLATSAMLAQLNNQRHDTLMPKGDYTHPELVENIRHVLTRDWEINNLADLSDTIKTLNEKKSFTGELNTWEVLSGEELKIAATKKDQLGDYSHVMDMVHNYRDSLPGGDMAWHYGRCSWLIRMSAFLKYITEEEAWALLEDNGRRIKTVFSSWAEFGLSYMVGAQYWRRNTYTPEAVRRYTKHFQFLITNKESPWTHVSWGIEL
ncbi:DUF1266 domain-containing protein [Fodinibius salsisoli]|uniref:DUF1266 domain-containing protein n=1 Tax=Fodinibius salsisoli TaxID=2820877 RepID=A0ABT3PS97_9BACT|nr:DUF1266 domain-containing protein [Fodinibius salsisoli]MCW9708721.1 DUF1266 domain-containing protein [Fodinibius salsisoli]